EAAVEVGGARGVEEDRAEDGTDAGGPTGPEGDPDEHGPQIADRLGGEVDAAFAGERAEVEDAEEVETEGDDQDPAHAGDPFAGGEEDPAEQARGGGEGEED